MTVKLTLIEDTDVNSPVTILVGPRGVVGPSSYDGWIALGNVGTEIEYQDWLSDGAITKTTDNVTAAQLAETNAAASEIAAATSETNTSISEAAASVSETNAAASEAASLVSETNAATSETAAAGSATASATSAAGALVSEDAAAASAAAALISENNADASETVATTKAAEAVVSATAASASEVAAAGSETASALSETNAAASELSASTDAATATTQAGIATTQATASSTSATAAQTAQTAAELAETGAETALASGLVAQTAAELAETNAAASEAGVAADAATATTKAAESVTSAAAALASQTSATASQTAAATSKTAAELAEVNAEAAEANASASEIASATSETNAATSATASATSATASAGSATAASTSESNAATSAATATTKASEASTSAGLAATAKTAAETAQTAAELAEVNAAADAAQTSSDLAAVAAIFDTFDDRYLGPKATAPTLDNDGDPLLVGAVYWNTTDNKTQFWNGAAWEDSEAAAAASAQAASDAQIAAEVAQAAAEAAQTSATSSANSATTSASNASTSETNAASSETAAATSASTATTQASAAGTSATNALASETAAGASETAAAGSASSAGSSATAASGSATAASDSATAAGTSATNAAASETAAAGSAATASTDATTATTQAGIATTAATAAGVSETNAAASEASAAIDAGTATTQAGVATTQAGLASTSATAAQTAQTAAELAETNAGSSETAAAASASSASTDAGTATTQAGIATTQASTATTQASAASTSASNAAASETAAGTSESNAAGSATAAGTSATNAANSATAAQTAETATVAARDDFFTRYIGQYVDDAAANASGYTITEGVFYWNSTSNGLLIHDGTGWNQAVLEAGDALVPANNLSDLINAATARTNLGLGTAAVTAATNYATAAQGSTADSALQPGDIGSSVQGYSATLAGTTASFTTADETKLDGIEAGATADQTPAQLMTAIKTVDGSGSLLDADLLDGQHASAFATAAQGATADTATQPGDAISTLTNDTGFITSADGGAAATAATLATARTISLGGDVTGSTSFNGSGNVTITATVADDSHNHTTANVDGLDAALALKAPLASPALTGTPTAPTAVSTTNTTQIASTAFVKAVVADLVAAAPGTMDTLNEIAAALGDDPNFATTMTNSLAGKASTASVANAGNWDTAFGWGDHSVSGYLTTVSWAAVTGKPTTFTPSAHSHPISEISDWPVAVTMTEAGYLDGVTSSIQTQLNGKAASAHTHTTAQVTGLDTALAGKATTAQGALADTALQPATIGSTVQGYSAVLNATTASFLVADEAKLDGIEAGADVTDTTNVTAAGALMDSEVTNLAAVKAFNPASYLGVSAKAADSELLDGLDSAAFLRSDQDDSFTTLTGTEVTVTGTTYWKVSQADDALQRADARDEGTTFSRLYWYGQNDTGGTSNFRHAWYDGAEYIHVTALSGGIDFTGTASHMTIGGNQVFHDGYHPNADTLTTSRTISLGGDVTGSASFNGSANVTITATIADDSHNHIIANVDGLQTALDGKATTAQGAKADTAVQPAAIANSANWDTAYAWGNHASAGYAAASHTHSTANVTGLDAALAAKAPLASAALTGVPTAPTAALATNTTQLATTAFVLANSTTDVALADITDWPAGVTATEAGYLNGVSSSIQTQLNGKAATSHTHPISSISDWPTSISMTEVDYLNGVTNYIQTQLDSKSSLTSTNTWTQAQTFNNGMTIYGNSSVINQMTFTTPPHAGQFEQGVLSNSGATINLGLDLTAMHVITLNQNTTLNFSSTAAMGGSVTCTILVHNTGGTFTLTWPSGILTEGNAALEAPASGKKALYVVSSYDPYSLPVYMVAQIGVDFV